MAKEAIRSVKEAEDEVKKMLEEAMTASRQSNEKAIEKADQEYKRILRKAEQGATDIREKAAADGKSQSNPIIEKGEKDAKAILSTSDDKLDAAASIIIEKVVNANGNS